MEICERRHLWAPNVWAMTEVLDAGVRVRTAADSGDLAAVLHRIDAALPERGAAFGPFVPATAEADRVGLADWVRLLGQVALTLQGLARPPATPFLRILPTRTDGLFRAILESRDAALVQACLDEALAIVVAARSGEVGDLTAVRDGLVTRADDVCIGPSTMLIVQAAVGRGIPWRRLGRESLVQLGQGRAQRRIWTAETDSTPAIAEGISRDKQLTKELLAAAGVPVPEGRVVASADEAWEAAQAVGVPVVVKPLDGNHGRGVFLNLSTAEEVRGAFPVAAEEGRHVSTVVVEQFVPGVEHRLLVVGGRMRACAKGEHLYVTGDGIRTVAELIDSQINSDARRGRSEMMPNKTVDIDATVRAQLAQERVAPETVPADGRRVLVKQIGSHGLDVTAAVHPEMAALAVRAARAVGLDVAGIDLIARDIGSPPAAQGARVCEVNAGPQLLIHSNPAQGPGQPVGEAIVDELFLPGKTGRIPIAAVVGRNATATARVLERLLRQAGGVPGLTCGAGKWVAGWPCSTQPQTDVDAARNLLVSPEIDTAVCELDWRSVRQRGLPVDRWDLLVLAPLTAAEIATDTATEPVEESFAAVVGLMLQAVAPSGTIVVPDGDEWLAQQAAGSGRATIAVARAEPVGPASSTARRVGIREGGVVVVADAGSVPVATLARALEAAGPGVDAESILTAVAAALGLGLSVDAIRRGLHP